jgi:hypothetical protein
VDDDELRRRLDTIERGLTERLVGLNAALGEARNDLMALMNNQHERLINDIVGLRNDYINTKGFLLQDAAARGRQWLDLEDRVSKLEQKRNG